MKPSKLRFYIASVTGMIVLLPIFMSDGHFLPKFIPTGFFSNSDHTLHGIDISRHNGEIVWPEVKNHQLYDQSLHFVVIKATEGGDWVDPNFQTNWENAKSHQMIRGAYHFYNPQTAPEVQAENYLNTVQHRTGDFVPVLDFEKDGRSRTERENLAGNAQQWLEIVEKKVGVKPIIYTNQFIYKRYIKDQLEDYDIWLADYSIYDPKVFGIKNLIMWQHTDGGKVTGISKNTDLNIFYGNAAKFEKYLLK